MITIENKVQQDIEQLLDQVIGKGIFDITKRSELLLVITGKQEMLSFTVSIEQANYLQVLMLDFYAMNRIENEKQQELKRSIKS